MFVYLFECLFESRQTFKGYGRVNDMMMENMITFENCCSYQVMIDRNLELAGAAEKALK